VRGCVGAWVSEGGRHHARARMHCPPSARCAAAQREPTNGGPFRSEDLRGRHFRGHACSI
jgi:hypothetical protein